ncbi:hypothetical protein DAPPUDRAFT_317184 [Daphnia pulex]|uniref:PHD-type domain-containing protein n=1 Tax=Daphnia pulex TaxID=6669 RepID=E9GF69_DAPPU|nr:hypothetical protein DAPPUDRAFT_317184 [Daphnia pulex]|eukprot:EFX81863.1 hypothetical protein DAPPUDRAFT_317184 [Daphnia pulex]
MADSTVETNPNSQENRKKDEMENFEDEICALTSCETNLGRTALSCVTCHQWFHGSCVDVTREIADSMEQEGLKWSCNVCTAIFASPVLKKPFN